MALFGEILGRSRAVLKNSRSCLHKIVFSQVFLHLSKRYMKVLSSALQKEHSGDSTFLSLKSILFTKRILFSLKNCKFCVDSYHTW